MSNILKYKVQEIKVRLPDSGFNGYINFHLWFQSLKARFFRIVKGVGDLNSYLMSEHQEVYGSEEKYLKLDSIAFKTIRYYFITCYNRSTWPPRPD